MIIELVRKCSVLLVLVFLQAGCNYYSFGFLSAIAYSSKPNVIMLNLFYVINYILWLPLGLLGHTKYGMLLEWNYPAMMFVNAFFAVGIIYYSISLFARK